MNASHLQFLIIVLTNLDAGPVDWAEVARISGINRKDNAGAKFRSIMKQYGVEYKNNKFTTIMDVEATSKSTSPSADRKMPVSSKKRRPYKDDAIDDVQESPTKKRKSEASAAENVKSEAEDRGMSAETP